MRRRDLLSILGGVALARPRPARAGAPSKRPLIGACYLERNQAEMTAFVEGMRSRGYIEGRGFDIVYRFADNDLARLPAIADELAMLKPDVLVCQEPASALAVAKVTKSVAIVGAILDDPEGFGLAASEARPGGNITGVLSAIPGLTGKLVNIARDLIPNAVSLGVIVNPDNRADLLQEHDLVAPAKALDVKLVVADVRTAPDLDRAFTMLKGASVSAVIVAKDALLRSEARRIADLAVAAHMPIIAGGGQWVDVGGLISYGVDTVESFRRAAYFVDRILKGTKPGDLPIEFPTKLEMVVNLKTAKILGLAIPEVLMLQANRVID